MKEPKTAKAKNIFYKDIYSHSGVQRLIKHLMDAQGISQFTLSKRAGLNPATIYQILKKAEHQVSRPPRVSTLSALAGTVGAGLVFDSTRKSFTLYQEQGPKTSHKDVNRLLAEIAVVLAKLGKTRIADEERKRIVRVVKAVL